MVSLLASNSISSPIPDGIAWQMMALLSLGRLSSRPRFARCDWMRSLLHFKGDRAHVMADVEMQNVLAWRQRIYDPLLILRGASYVVECLRDYAVVIDDLAAHGH